MSKKVILITGASSGIGKATALQLLQEGYVVYGAARRVEKMADLEAKGMHALAMDITKDEEIQRVVNTIQEAHGGIDVLVNNAGFGLYGAVEDTTMDDARYQFEVNIFGLARLTQLALPYMREQKAGTIINISSMGGKIYFPLGAWYHATKHALEGWSDSLRLELKQFNIKVVIVEPGAIASEFGDVVGPQMLERSGSGAYATLTKNIAEALKKSYEQGGSSPTSVIAKVISKAIKARKPKTRYVAGKYAGTMLFLRRWLSDDLFDKVALSMAK
ncbi:MAG: oxidoreductase [Aureispira sp.]